jgi:hypothetical protein
MLSSLSNVKDNVIKYIKPFIEIFGIYILWILLHYICSHLYVAWCTPLTINGFLMSPFIVPSPHCQAFRWIIMNGSSSITMMWFSLGTWISKKLVF